VILAYRANHGIKKREDTGLEQKGDHGMLNIGIFYLNTYSSGTNLSI
jgi:hypothetical protein